MVQEVGGAEPAVTDMVLSDVTELTYAGSVSVSRPKI